MLTSTRVLRDLAIMTPMTILLEHLVVRWVRVRDPSWLLSIDIAMLARTIRLGALRSMMGWKLQMIYIGLSG